MTEQRSSSTARRDWVASVLWMVAVLAAAILALGALLVALDADADNAVVGFFHDAAVALDGPFGNLFSFEGGDAESKNRLVNWGLGAVAYLVVGRVLDRLIRP